MSDARTAKAFQPIENYGVIGNMRSIALVSVEGSIDFLCYPDFDSPTVFAALLDAERGGSFALNPDLEDMRVKQLYLPNTNILLTRFLSESGVAEVTDFMPVGSEKDKSKQRYGNHIIRMLRVIKGHVRFEMHCAPRFDYARAGHRVQQVQNAVAFLPDCPDCPSMALHATFPLRIDGIDVKASFTLERGETAMMAFGQVGRRGADARRAPRSRQCRGALSGDVAFLARLDRSIELHGAAGAKWSTARRWCSSCCPAPSTAR